MKNYANSAAYMCKRDSMGRMEAHAEVLKKTGQEMLTAKAYNGRCAELAGTLFASGGRCSCWR